MPSLTVEQQDHTRGFKVADLKVRQAVREAVKQKAVEEVMAKAAKAEQHQQKRKSLGGSSSLKKLKGGKK